jgi:hypothetical protein
MLTLPIGFLNLGSSIKMLLAALGDALPTVCNVCGIPALPATVPLVGAHFDSFLVKI